MRLKWVLGLGLTALLVSVLATSVAAQEEPPSPYAGLKNPFPWGDSSAQAAGQSIYKQSCLGCHGAKGDGQAAFNFSKPDYGNGLEARPDFYFWVTSEGRLNKGMPPFKSSLSEEKRWQVLSYIRSLGKDSLVSGPSAQPAAENLKGTLSLVTPENAETGQTVVLKGLLKDDNGNPIADANVKFFLREDFFTTGLMEIGEATTDAQGVASLEYIHRRDGKTEIVARYGSSEASTITNIAQGTEPGYETEAGLQFPVVGGHEIIFPRSVLTLRDMDKAPLPAFRLPGGILSWILILVAIVFMIYFTYLRVMYQIFRIPVVSEIRDINTRLMPTLGMAFLATIGLMLILKLLISPYSHLHIPLF